MLTSAEIHEVTFNRGFGYKANEVDQFLEECAETVDALTAARAELEKKLEVLADKLVEYRNDEDSIRSALLSAQRLGDSVVREANQKADLILEDARIKAETVKESARQSIGDEEAELKRIKQEVTKFRAGLFEMYQKHLALIDAIPHEENEAEPAAKAETAPSEAQEPVRPAAAPVAAPVAAIPLVKNETATSGSHFGDLKFGDNYDVTADND